MRRLNPQKLHVTDLSGTALGINLPRHYTLTHSDMTGDLFLTIGNKYDDKSTSRLYTRLMRDEVLAELVNNEGCLELRVYCHVSGGLVFGTARLRDGIFRAELPLALEAIRYGDRALFENDSKFDQATVNVYFRSHRSKYNRVENWGIVSDYR